MPSTAKPVGCKKMTDVPCPLYVDRPVAPPPPAKVRTSGRKPHKIINKLTTRCYVIVKNRKTPEKTQEKGRKHANSTQMTDLLLKFF
jgi:hypothetical protein